MECISENSTTAICIAYVQTAYVSNGQSSGIMLKRLVYCFLSVSLNYYKWTMKTKHQFQTVWRMLC